MAGLRLTAAHATTGGVQGLPVLEACTHSHNTWFLPSDALAQPPPRPGLDKRPSLGTCMHSSQGPVMARTPGEAALVLLGRGDKEAGASRPGGARLWLCVCVCVYTHVRWFFNMWTQGMRVCFHHLQPPTWVTKYHQRPWCRFHVG